MNINGVNNVYPSYYSVERSTPALPYRQPQQPDTAGSSIPKNPTGTNIIYNSDGDSLELSSVTKEFWRQLRAAYATGQPGSDTYPLDYGFDGSRTFISPFGDRTDISGAAYAAFNGKSTSELGGAEKSNIVEPEGQCQTCANRKYVDKSDDASVSYQSPTKIHPNQAATAVAAHEYEHVRNERASAAREDRVITNQTVTLHYDICPDCGRSYVSGGVTRTSSVSVPDSSERQPEPNDNLDLS